MSGALIAPLVAIVPPHVPWAAGAGLGGLFLGLRKWHERFTLTDVEGPCPRCGAALVFAGRAPLRQPHSLHCPGCQTPVVLRIASDVLPAG